MTVCARPWRRGDARAAAPHPAATAMNDGLPAYEFFVAGPRAAVRSSAADDEPMDSFAARHALVVARVLSALGDDWVEMSHETITDLDTGLPLERTTRFQRVFDSIEAAERVRLWKAEIAAHRTERP